MQSLIAVDVIFLGCEVEVEAVRKLRRLLGSHFDTVLLNLFLGIPQRCVLIPGEILIDLEASIAAMLVLPCLHIYY